jgi:hypothetical protein
MLDTPSSTRPDLTVGVIYKDPQQTFYFWVRLLW